MGSDGRGGDVYGDSMGSRVRAALPPPPRGVFGTLRSTCLPGREETDQTAWGHQPSLPVSIREPWRG